MRVRHYKHADNFRFNSPPPLELTEIEPDHINAGWLGYQWYLKHKKRPTVR